MQTECVRCHKMIDTVQGYKFSANEYVCMSCYDEYKAERTTRAKKQHKNPLLDQFGAKSGSSVSQTIGPEPAPKSHVPPSAPAEPKPAAPQSGPQPIPAPPAAAPRSAKPAKAPSPPQQEIAAEVCDVCKKPLKDFKVPIKGGKKVCWDCNGILREVAKSLILTVPCPHCGKEIQLTKE